MSTDKLTATLRKDSWYIPYNELISSYKWEIIGYSSEERPILSTHLGHGERRICIWAGMHGNETTGVFIILKLLRELQLKQPDLLTKFSFHVIPVVNPDAYVRYSRRNGVGIDLNRDFRAFQTLESAKLIGWIKMVDPELCFNLHDQRTIFHVNGKPAFTSLLVPSADQNRLLSPVRSELMGRLGAALDKIDPNVELNIGRYSDEYYPTAVGDYLMSQNIPNILIESGVDHLDWNRLHARDFGVDVILNTIITNETNISRYLNIPENQTGMLELVFTNVTYARMKVDIAIKRVPIVVGHEQLILYKVDDIGDLASRPRHLSIPCINARVDDVLEIDHSVTADFEEYIFENGVLIKHPQG